MYEIGKSVGLLSNLQNSVINKLQKEVEWCICDYVSQSVMGGSNTCSINLGFGILIINIDGNTIRYRFEPSTDLESAVSKSVIDGYNPLQEALNEKLVQRLSEVYEEML